MTLIIANVPDHYLNLTNEILARLDNMRVN